MHISGRGTHIKRASLGLLDAVFVPLKIAMRQDCALLPTERRFGEGTLALLCQNCLQTEVLILTSCVGYSTGPVCVFQLNNRGRCRHTPTEMQTLPSFQMVMPTTLSSADTRSSSPHREQAAPHQPPLQ